MVNVVRAEGQVVLPKPVRKQGVEPEAGPAKIDTKGEKEMRQTAQTLVVFSAALGLLALTETAGDAAFNVENYSPTNQYGAVRVPSRVEVRRAPDGSPVLVRVNSPQEEDSAGAYPPFTCAQLQVIDEVEISSEEDAAACDSNAD